MSKVRLTGSTSGYSEIQAPAVAGDQTFTLPGTGGTLALQGQSLTQGTAVAASTTAVAFTGIPSWAKRITMILDQISLSGTADVGVQLGSTTYVTSGYRGTQAGISAGGAASSLWSTLASVQGAGSAAAVWNGIIEIDALGSSNIWAISLSLGQSNVTRLCLGSGTVTLSGTLDRVRLYTSNGTDTFDAGTVNIMYEG